MTKQLCCLAVTVLCLAVTPCVAATSAWNGTWKLDQAKSQMTGATFTVTKAGGMYVLNNGSITYKFACDGKDYAVVSGHTTACTMNGNAIHWVNKANGKVLETANDQLSSDGKTWTSVANGTRADGATYTNHETDVRQGNGSGIVGTWKQAKVDSSATSEMRIQVNGDVLHLFDPGDKVNYEAKLDGTPAAVTGGNTPPGVMVSARMEGKEITLVTTLNGKKVYSDQWNLSPDGRVLTDAGWSPGQESHKQTYVYHRE